MSSTLASVTPIPSRPRPACPLCGAAGSLLYGALDDPLYEVPGRWSLRGCARCQLAWVDPQPLPEALERVYETYYTHVDGRGRRPLALLRDAAREQALAMALGYPAARRPAPWRQIGALVARVPLFRESIVMQHLGIDARWGRSLLDVGCGSGRFLAAMRELGWQVRGVEVDSLAVQRARDELGLDVSLGTLEAAGFPDQSFDVVTHTHVMEHVYEPLALLRECTRVLKPGGRLVLIAVNVEGLGHWLFRRSWSGLEVPRHLTIFSARALGACLEQAGLELVIGRSTARAGRNLYQQSRMIAAGRRLVGMHRQAGTWLRLESYLFQLAEELLRPLVPKAGEELYFVARKPALAP
jgi:2-polyprenyl-3-methyl-5-hydroxy-6-metoxy-1,4-benzoquinol methylase